MIHDYDKLNVSKVQPFISVIIIAYNRTEYIIKATESVIDQTMERSRYEIIVSKNFKDRKIDEFLDKNVDKNIYDDCIGIGKRLANLAGHVSGEVVTFLEDDDLYYKEKLNDVATHFMNDNSLIFFHNSFITTNENLVPIPSNFFYKPKKEFTFSTQGLITSWFFLASEGAFHNLSSISVRKCLFQSSNNILEKIIRSPDLFFFANALISNGSLTFSSKELTIFRMHESASIDLALSYNSWISNKINIFSFFLSDSSYILRLLRNTNIELMGKFMIKIWQSNILSINKYAKRKTIIKDIIQYKRFKKYLSKKYSFRILLLKIRLFSISLSSHVYYLFEKNKFKL